MANGAGEPALNPRKGHEIICAEEGLSLQFWTILSFLT
jgi:hypothetical protein